MLDSENSESPLENIENEKKECTLESNIKAKSERLHSLQLTLISFYFTFIIIFALACIFFPGIKSEILSIFMMMQIGSIKMFMILILCSTMLYIFCFPVAIFEIFLGSMIHPYWLAVTVAVVIKLLSNVTMFYISRFWLKEEINHFFSGNKVFLTIQRAIKKNPIKIIFMLKLMMIPHMLKNYGLGVMEVTFWQYFLPALITGSIYSAFWVNIGSKLTNVYSIFNSQEIAEKGEIKDFELNLYHFKLLFRIGIVILSIILFFLLGYYGKKQYEQVQKELINDEYQQITNEINQITYGTMKNSEEN